MPATGRARRVRDPAAVHPVRPLGPQGRRGPGTTSARAAMPGRPTTSALDTTSARAPTTAPRADDRPPYQARPRYDARPGYDDRPRRDGGRPRPDDRPRYDARPGYDGARPRPDDRPPYDDRPRHDAMPPHQRRQQRDDRAPYGARPGFDAAPPIEPHPRPDAPRHEDRPRLEAGQQSAWSDGSRSAWSGGPRPRPGGHRPGPRPGDRRPARPYVPLRPAVAADPSLALGPDDELVAGRRPVEEAFVARREARRLYVVPQRRQALEKLVLHATSLRIPVVEVEGGTLTSIAGFDGHQGIALVVAPRRWASPDDILAAASARGEAPLVLVLDSLEDPQNVGTLLRTAEASGVHGAVFPTRHQAPLSPAAVKASAGAVEHLPLAPVDDLPGAVADLHARGLRIVGADGDAPLTAREADLRGPIAIIVGSEGKGLGPAIRRRCDLLVRIPMHGRIESLNAAVAGSILLYEAAAQRRLPDPGPRPAEPAPAERVRRPTVRCRPTVRRLPSPRPCRCPTPRTGRRPGPSPRRRPDALDADAGARQARPQAVRRARAARRPAAAAPAGEEAADADALLPGDPAGEPPEV